VTPAIVHVASGREWRGGQRQVWLLARELGRLGAQQVVVTGGDSELARRLKASGVRVRPASWRAGLDPRVAWPILDELRQGGAVLHAHDAHALTLAALCAALTRTPLVVTRRVIFPLRRRFLWRQAHRIIAISSAVREALLAEGLEPERVIVIPSAVDLDGLSAHPNDGIRHRLGLPRNGQVAVNLGALTAEKDQSTLVVAAARLVQDLPDLHWVIVGDGPLRARLEAQILEKGVQSRFHLIGHMADPEQALAGADLYVLSSTSEGLGSSALAAMALGVPVVATRVGGVPDLLGSGRGIMVEPRNPAAFADAVRRVLTDSGLRQELTSAARKELARYSLGAMAERVQSVYRSCAHSHDGS
jgi:glycosyltransferase involved in cell wall biosynthesis